MSKKKKIKNIMPKSQESFRLTAVVEGSQLKKKPFKNSYLIKSLLNESSWLLESHGGVTLKTCHSQRVVGKKQKGIVIRFVLLI